MKLKREHDWYGIKLDIFASFSPTCTGSYCQKTPHTKYLAAYETPRLQFL